MFVRFILCVGIVLSFSFVYGFHCVNMPKTGYFPVWGYTDAMNILIHFFGKHGNILQGRYVFSFSRHCQTIVLTYTPTSGAYI